jgi:hypothetical protein
MSKIFLGGTCNNSTWRKDLIKLLNIDYFNPVAQAWTSQSQEEEIKQRELCDYNLYVITPKMKGVYSIAEVVDDSNKRPNKTVFCILDKDFDNDLNLIKFEDFQMKSLNQVGKMIEANGSKFFRSLAAVASYVNK